MCLLDGGLRKAAIVTVATAREDDGVVLVGDAAGLVRAVQLPHATDVPPAAREDNRAVRAAAARIAGGHGGGGNSIWDSGDGRQQSGLKKLAANSARNMATAASNIKSSGISIFNSFKNWYASKRTAQGGGQGGD